MGIDYREAIGAHEANAVLASRGHQGVPDARSLFAEFLEAPGGYGQAGYSLATALLHHPRHGGRGNDDHPEVNCFGEIANGFVQVEAERPASLGINAVDVSLVIPIDKVLEDIPSQVSGSIGCSDNYHVACVEYLFHAGNIIAPVPAASTRYIFLSSGKADRFKSFV